MCLLVRGVVVGCLLVICDCVWSGLYLLVCWIGCLLISCRVVCCLLFVFGCGFVFRLWRLC